MIRHLIRVNGCLTTPLQGAQRPSLRSLQVASFWARVLILVFAIVEAGWLAFDDDRFQATDN